MPSVNINKKHTLHTKSDNADIMISKDTNEIIQELFDSIVDRYQEGLEQSMEDSSFVFDHVNGLHCKSHKISLKHGRS